MTVQEFLQNATKTLQAAGIETARLDTFVLLEDVMETSRAALLAHPGKSVPEQRLTALSNFITQREKHTPLAYIRGKVMFYGREFIVNNHVLVPRPESEAIIDCLRQLPLGGTPRIADIGTGSGCLGVTTALELFGAKVFLCDIDAAALAVAKKNAQVHNVAVQIKQQDLLKNCAEQFDVILANLPYVPESYPINQAAEFEPKQALFSGADGMDHYGTFWQQIASMPGQPTHVITECLPEQHKSQVKLAKAAGYALENTRDFAQHFVRLSATED
jgi:release factor glutamine methyltransferase